jgi:hypothetical protein
MAESRATTVSSFTIVKGALLEPTYELFRHWDLSASKKQNLDEMKRSDPAGVGTASWLLNVAKVVNRRFDTDGRDRVLVELAKAEVSTDLWHPLVIWHMTRDEFLFRDFLLNWLFPLHANGTWRVRTEDLVPYLDELHARTDIDIKDAWSPATTSRVAAGLLGMAVDFGLMTGSLTREFVPYHLADEALLYLVHAVAETEPNAHRLIHLPDWRMYLLGPDDVEHELFRLHQQGRLRYEVAGTVSELRLPYPTAAEYARKELMA